MQSPGDSKSQHRSHSPAKTSARPSPVKTSGKRLSSAHGDANPESELIKWRETYEVLAPMLSKQSDLKFNTPSNDNQRRAVLTGLCQDVCRTAAHPEESVPYKRLNNKYKQQKLRHGKLHKQTQMLMEEVERNRQILDKYLRESRRHEKDQLEMTLRRLEALLDGKADNAPNSNEEVVASLDEKPKERSSKKRSQSAHKRSAEKAPSRR